MGALCVDNIRVAVMMTRLSFQLQYAVEGNYSLCQFFTSDKPGSQNIGFHFVDGVSYCFICMFFSDFL